MQSDDLLPGISVVVPVYQSVESLPLLTSRVAKILGPDSNFELILVDDGSRPETWEQIVSLEETSTFVRALRFGRNYGQHSALVAGIRSARYDITVTIDDDLQNPPEEIPILIEALQPGVDVVYGVSDEIAQGLWRRMAAHSIRRVLRRSAGAESAPHMSSFRAIRTNLREAFAGDLGPGVSIDALLTWATSRFESVTVSHDERQEGRSNYSLRKLVRFAIDTTTGYSVFPLQIASILGLVAAALSLLILIYVVGRLLITGESVPGFPFLASIVAFFAGMQLFALGIIGEYLARMHYRIMGKPTYFIAEQIQHGQASGQPNSDAGTNRT